MAIPVFDATNEAVGSASSHTYALTISSGGSLVVSTNSRDNFTGTQTVTYNAVSMTEYTGSDDTARLWYLAAPDTGSSYNVIATFNGSGNCGSIAVSYTGVDKADMIGATNFATGSSTTPSVNVTTDTANSIVVDTMTIGVGSQSLTPGSGQTQRGTDISPGTNFTGAFSEEDAATASTVTMSWTAGTSNGWGIATMEIHGEVEGAISWQSTSLAEASTTGATASASIDVGTGSDRCLIVYIWDGFVETGTAGDNFTAVTYNSVAMTQFHVEKDSIDRYFYMYYLVNPASGSNTMTVTRTTTTSNLWWGSASYVNVDQTTPLVNSADSGLAGSGGTSVSVTVNIGTDTSWQVSGMRADNGGITASAGTLRHIYGTADRGALVDSDGALSTGNNTHTINCAAGSSRLGVAGELQQVGGGGPAKLKTYDTVAAASVKTIDGVAIASVKTIDTVV
jgi:hypothetical protein